MKIIQKDVFLKLNPIKVVISYSCANIALTGCAEHNEAWQDKNRFKKVLIVTQDGNLFTPTQGREEYGKYRSVKHVWPNQ